MTLDLCNPCANLTNPHKTQMKGVEMTYIEQQFLKVAPFPFFSEKNGQISIKINSERGATNWIGISPETMRKIEDLLVEEEDRLN